MVLCTCPIRCKGGRNVSERTRSAHEREIQEEERQRRLQKFFPSRDMSQLGVPQRKRGSADDDNTSGSHSKRARGDIQQDEIGIQAVRVLTSLSRLKLTSWQAGHSTQ